MGIAVQNKVHWVTHKNFFCLRLVVSEKGCQTLTVLVSEALAELERKDPPVSPHSAKQHPRKSSVLPRQVVSRSVIGLPFGLIRHVPVIF